MNVYKVYRLWGGPEEGGWWYDQGRPLESRRVPAGDPYDVRKELEQAWASEQPRRDRFKVGGGPDIEVRIEGHFAENFPKARPHYE